eukprot:3311944-Amphidinium_carterae.1
MQLGRIVMSRLLIIPGVPAGAAGGVSTMLPLDGQGNQIIRGPRVLGKNRGLEKADMEDMDQQMHRRP